MKNWIYILLLAGIMISCDDVLVPELDDVHITMITPAQVDSTNNASITFWWEEEERADKYRIQIVRPSFANVEEIELDTTVTGLSMITSLEPGDFEWVIRAVNSVSETENPVINSLYVDQNIDLTNFKPTLTYPTDGLGVRNNEVVHFRWIGHPGVTRYELFLNNKSDNQSKIVYIDNLGLNPEQGEFDTTFNYLSTRNMEWSIQAFNDNSFSVSSDLESFIVDTAVVLP